MKRSHEDMVAEDADGVSVAVVQQPPAQASESDADSINVIEDVFFKHDLLPKILSFVVDTSNYLTLLRSVNQQQWKQALVGNLEPPFLDTMAQISLEHDTTGLIITKQVAIPLFKQALVSLQDNQSPMYRQMPRDETLLIPDGEPTFKKWPSLWPRNHVTLSYFFYVVCLQNPPHCHKEHLYNVTREYLNRLFVTRIQQCAKILALQEQQTQQEQDDNTTGDPLTQLEELVSIWRQLRGIAKTVVSMTSYLDKFYVSQTSQKSLATIQELADRALLIALEQAFGTETIWIKTTTEATSQLDLVMEHALKEISTMEDGSTFLAHLPLLEKSLLACDTLRTVLEKYQIQKLDSRNTIITTEDDIQLPISVTTLETIIQICTRVGTAIRPVVEAMKKVRDVIKKRGLDPDNL